MLVDQSFGGLQTHTLDSIYNFIGILMVAYFAWQRSRSTPIFS